MLKKLIGLGSVTALLSVIAYGCSSSGDNSAPTGDDSGGTTDAATDHKKPPVEASDDTSGDDTGTGDDSSTGNCPQTGFQPLTWQPPSAWGTGACTDPQITGFTQACLKTGGPTCDTWLKDPNNTACVGCLMPNYANQGATAWGPLIAMPLNQQYFTLVGNFGGCAAHEDGKTGATDCGSKIESAEECVSFDCGLCTSSATFTQCQKGVVAGDCKQYIDQTCEAELNDGGVAAVCDNVTNFLGLWCAGGDAGPTDAGGG